MDLIYPAPVIGLILLGIVAVGTRLSNRTPCMQAIGLVVIGLLGISSMGCLNSISIGVRFFYTVEMRGVCLNVTGLEPGSDACSRYAKRPFEKPEKA